MRVSIFNCVSTAIDMLKFSTDAIINNAGTDDFDYIIVTWLPTDEVNEYLSELSQNNKNVHVVRYNTNESVGYVPNLRGMMNAGFEHSFSLNDYAGLSNTDMYFGKDWLVNLVKFAEEDVIISSTHISPTTGVNIKSHNLGVTEYGKFNLAGFDELYKVYYKENIISDKDMPSWKYCLTMPYLFHRKIWDVAGPWELNINKGTPDVRFFQRCHDAGAECRLSCSSIVYHHHAVERSGKRPVGTEHMKQEM